MLLKREKKEKKSRRFVVDERSDFSRLYLKSALLGNRAMSILLLAVLQLPQLLID